MGATKTHERDTLTPAPYAAALERLRPIITRRPDGQADVALDIPADIAPEVAGVVLAHVLRQRDIRQAHVSMNGRHVLSVADAR